MLTAPTPGAALFARTFSHASKTSRFGIPNDFNFFCFGPTVGSSPEPLTSKRP